MKMLRLIDALALCDLANNNITKTVDANDIMRFPTIDAVPVVHGHWVFSENDDMFYCTNCKNGSVRNDYPYCHWCGAVMDGEKEKV